MVQGGAQQAKPEHGKTAYCKTTLIECNELRAKFPQPDVRVSFAMFGCYFVDIVAASRFAGESNSRGHMRITARGAEPWLNSRIRGATAWFKSPLFFGRRAEQRNLRVCQQHLRASTDEGPVRAMLMRFASGNIERPA